MTRFEISRLPWVSLTSTQHGGEDWEWRLMQGEETLVSGRGYTRQIECVAAVDALKKHVAAAAVMDSTGSV